MRTTGDRLRHAALFEVTALVIIAPAGGGNFGISVGHFKVVAVVSTSVARLWTYADNLWFDLAMLRLRLSRRKTLPIRVLHALVCEAGLLCLLVPFIAWYLAVPLRQALPVDLALSGLYLV